MKAFAISLDAPVVILALSPYNKYSAIRPPYNSITLFFKSCTDNKRSFSGVLTVTPPAPLVLDKIVTLFSYFIK